MNMLTELRIAALTAISGLTVPVWDRRVPKDVPEPTTYVLVTSQTISDSDRSKCGNDTKECTLLLDVIHKAEQGYADSSIVDQVVSDVIAAIDRNGYMPMTGFIIMDISLESADVQDAFEFQGQTVVRGLIRFRFKIR